MGCIYQCLTYLVDQLDTNPTIIVGRLNYHCFIRSFHHFLQLAPVLGHNVSPGEKAEAVPPKGVDHLLIASPQPVLPPNNKQAWKLINLDLKHIPAYKLSLSLYAPPLHLVQRSLSHLSPSQ